MWLLKTFQSNICLNAYLKAVREALLQQEAEEEGLCQAESKVFLQMIIKNLSIEFSLECSPNGGARRLNRSIELPSEC